MSFLQHTSPLAFEPLSPSSSEILVHDSDINDDDLDHRAAKRRRVEKLGRQYLKGQPLLISTASLRGPFDATWINPWKKTRCRKSRVDDTGSDWTHQTRKEWQEKELRKDAEKIHGKIEVYPTNHYGIKTSAPKGCPRCKSSEPRPGKRASSAEFRRPSAEDLLAFELAGVERRERRRLQTERREQRATELLRGGQRPQFDECIDFTGEDFETATIGTQASHTPAARRPYTPPYNEPIRTSPPSTTFSDHGFTPINRSPTKILCTPKHDAIKFSASPRSSDLHAVECALNPIISVVEEIKIEKAERSIIEGFLGAKALARQAASEATELASRAWFLKRAKRSEDIANVKILTPWISSPKNTRRNFTPQQIQAQISTPKSRSGKKTMVAVEVPSRRQQNNSSPVNCLGSIREIPPSTTFSTFKYRRTAAVPRKPSKADDANDQGGEKEQSIQEPGLIIHPLADSAPELPVVITNCKGQPSGNDGGDVNAISDASWDLVNRYTNKIITQNTFDDHSGSPQSVGVQIRDIFRQSASFHGQEHATSPDPNTVQLKQNSPQASSSPKTSDPISQTPSFRAPPPTSMDDYDLPQSPSAPPTSERFETDFSTQAAIAQAQRSFQADISSPLKQPSPAASPSAANKDLPKPPPTHITQAPPPPVFITPFRAFSASRPDKPTQLNPPNAEQPLSTQDLLNNLSPLTFSTAKKEPAKKQKRRTSFALSPLGQTSIISNDPDSTTRSTFNPNLEPDMQEANSFPPPRPKPKNPNLQTPLVRKSALKRTTPPQASQTTTSSFSISPDGVLKEVFNQDGGQAAAAAARINDDAELEQMIEDVGGYLESWDVEVEMRKVGANLAAAAGNDGDDGSKIIKTKNRNGESTALSKMVGRRRGRGFCLG